ncbi:MAG TPA: CPBP family intramembrane glutamic endopeptidase, partial [Cytophagaceae bacterium]|nr:CPBP family intramembrane glutamic endopeptidase [Cytophagaceae bacterium]
PLIGIIGDWNKSITLPESWNSMEVIMRAMELKAEKMTKLIVYYHSLSEGIMVFFTVALLPAIAEELVFRGILQNDLLKYTGNVHIAVFISAAIFSFIHLQFFGFFPRLLLGIILGYLYITSGNIIVSILMHFLNNAMVIVALNLYAQGTLKMDPESSKDLPKESVYLSILLSSALFYLCWSMYKQRTNTERTNV